MASFTDSYNTSSSSKDYNISIALCCLQTAFSRIKGLRSKFLKSGASQEDIAKIFVDIVSKIDANFCPNSTYYNKCTSESHVYCFRESQYIWNDALKHFNRAKSVKQNSNYISIDWAFQNLHDFSQAFAAHVKDFEKVRGIKSNSIISTEYQAELKNSLKKKMDSKFADQMDDHVAFCSDDGYSFDQIWLLECDFCMIQIKDSWNQSLTELIYELQHKSAWLADRSDYFLCETSAKDDRRKQFFKKAKGHITQTERRYRNKGLITKDIMFELRQKKKSLRRSEKYSTSPNEC